MQTFLPYPDFDLSAQCLDYRRLGKQRVETLQILKSLQYRNGWINHPAVQMWEGNEGLLAQYGIAICKEWIKRGYKDTCLDKILKFNLNVWVEPVWIGLKAFHESHQSNLVRKFPEHYRKFFPSVPNDLPYYWPTKNI